MFSSLTLINASIFVQMAIMVKTTTRKLKKNILLLQKVRNPFRYVSNFASLLCEAVTTLSEKEFTEDSRFVQHPDFHTAR